MLARFFALFVVACAPIVALAQTETPLQTQASPAQDTGATLDAEAFDHYVTGKTLTYAQSGLIFGIEEYLPNRRVRWSTAPDQCQYGRWYQKADMICFSYEYGSRDHCWQFWQSDKGLIARAEGASPSEDLNEVEQSPQALNCPAPDVGV